MASQLPIWEQPSLASAEEVEKRAALEEFLSLGGTFHELYERFGGVAAVIRDRHGMTEDDRVG